MGRDKATLDLAGGPLWRRQADTLWQTGASEVFLSARPEQSWWRDGGCFSAVLHDAFPDCGPIMGITAALERTSHPHIAVMAIDLPAMPVEWFRLLLEQCSPRVGCVGRNGTHYEPLAAVYPQEMKWLAWEQIARGEYSLQKLLADAERQGLIRSFAITAAQQPWFSNLNETSKPSVT